MNKKADIWFKGILIVFMAMFVFSVFLLLYAELDTDRKTLDFTGVFSMCAKEGEAIDAEGMPKQCCTGLKPIGSAGWKGDCSLTAPATISFSPAGLRVCSNCGDGVCNEKIGENNCNCQEDCEKSSLEGITINTNNDLYRQGDPIKIIVENNTKDDVWYEDYEQVGLSFWKIERLENSEWKEYSFTLPEKLVNRKINGLGFGRVCQEDVEIGDDICLPPPRRVYDGLQYETKNLSKKSETGLQSNLIVYEWSQKQCPMEEMLKSKDICFKPKFLEKGRYRIVFEYGTKIERIKVPEDIEFAGGYEIKEKSKIYSNEFVVE